MQSDLLRRFIIEEKYGDMSLIDMYNKGLWYPNFDEYSLFLKRCSLSNKLFAKELIRHHLIKKDEDIIETVFHKDYSISEFLNKKSVVVESNYGSIHVPSSIELIRYDICYISNGVFNDTFDIVKRVAKSSSFNVGVSAYKDSVFYKENIKYLKELKDILTKKHIKTTEYKASDNGNKVYILSHRREF